MTEEEQGQSELDYLRGNRAAWLSILGECIRQLGYDGSEAQKVRWISERESTIAMLRMVCKDHGDNDWPNDLHLADIIDKHLARHLD